MPDSTQIFDVQVYAAKASQSYEAATICLQAKKFNAATSRCYYACLQLAIFALLKNNICFDGNHRSILAAFRQRFLGEIPKLNGILEYLYPLRQTADYYDQNISPKNAQIAYARASEFREHLSPYLK